MLNKTLLAFCGVSAVCAVACGQSGSIAIVRSELTTIRSLLDQVPDQTGLQALSAPGKEVIRDVANLTVVIDGQGNWLYRHAGNNRELFQKQGGNTDKNTVLTAMRTKYWDHLSGIYSAKASNQLGSILMTPQGRSNAANLLDTIAQTADYPKPLRELINTQLGEAILELPADAKGQLLADAGTRETFLGALGTAMKLDRDRVASIVRAKPVADERTLTSLMALFPDRPDEGFATLFSVIKTNRITETDKHIFEVSYGGENSADPIKIYVRVKDDQEAGTIASGAGIDVSDFYKRWAAGGLRVYAAGPGTTQVEELPKTAIE